MAAEPWAVFAVLADVQYANKPPRVCENRERHYADAVDKLKRAVDLINKGPEVSFVVHLGDIIDGMPDEDATMADLHRVLAAFSELNVQPVRHVLGNHCLEVPRPDLCRLLGLAEDRPYYSFVSGRCRIIVLDSVEVQVGRGADCEEHFIAQRFLEENAELSYAKAYNGGVGDRQLQWLDAELTEADEAGQRAIICTHIPLDIEASTPALLLYNHEAVNAVIDRHASPIMVLAGHHHVGGYHARERKEGAGGVVHHFTMPAVLEAPQDGTSYALIRVFDGRIEMQGVGRVESATFLF